MKTSKKNPLIISLIGPPGCGKGTQADLLTDKFKFYYIGSGEMLRARVKNENDFTARKIKSCLDQGQRVASSVVMTMWINRLEEIKNKRGNHFPGAIIDGSPRTPLEGKMLEEALYWYEWDNFKALFININFEESKKRLLSKYQGRGRADDNIEDLKARWDWYKKEVLPTIEYFRSHHNLIEIDGQQSVKEVYQSIVEALRLDDNDKE